MRLNKNSTFYEITFGNKTWLQETINGRWIKTRRSNNGPARPSLSLSLSPSSPTKSSSHVPPCPLVLTIYSSLVCSPSLTCSPVAAHPIVLAPCSIVSERVVTERFMVCVWKSITFTKVAKCWVENCYYLKKILKILYPRQLYYCLV